jgi:hypothetical protein
MEMRKLQEGDVIETKSGRKTSRFPKISCDTDRKTWNSVKRARKWLWENAIAEAKAVGDTHVASLFENDKPTKGNWPQASLDSFEHYLFGY